MFDKKYQKETIVFLSIFVVLFLPIRIRNAFPTSMKEYINNPILKILGIFGLLYWYLNSINNKNMLWLSLLGSAAIVSIFEILRMFRISQPGGFLENFCNFREQKLCSKEDYCHDEVDKQENAEQYLDETDNFIKELYGYLDVESPAFLQENERKTDLVRIVSDENKFLNT